MRSQCAVYVDAGYLLAATATRVTGTSLRSAVDVNHGALIEQIIEQAEADSGLPLLRPGAHRDDVPGQAAPRSALVQR
jgi:hypothetical protein